MATNAKAKVTVTFTDGSESEYLITAHKGIASDLANAAAAKGILAIWNDEQSFGIPVANILDWEVVDLSPEEIAAEAA